MTPSEPNLASLLRAESPLDLNASTGLRFVLFADRWSVDPTPIGLTSNTEIFALDELKPLDISDADIVDIATPIFTSVIDAHQVGDYDKLAAHLSEAMKQGLTRQKFDEAINDHLSQLGPVKETAYLGSLRKGEKTQTLWKARYENDNQELLWQLFLARCGNEVKLVGLWFS